jgi:hypothetical protein
MESFTLVAAILTLMFSEIFDHKLLPMLNEWIYIYSFSFQNKKSQNTMTEGPSLTENNEVLIFREDLQWNERNDNKYMFNFISKIAL